MPLINNNFEFIPPDKEEAINEVLIASGIDTGKPQLPPEEDFFKQTLNKNGASVDNASHTIAGIMKYGKFENSRLKAAEIVLDLHGVRDREGKVNTQPIFQFLIRDSEININSIFSPIRNNFADDLDPAEQS